MNWKHSVLVTLHGKHELVSFNKIKKMHFSENLLVNT